MSVNTNEHYTKQKCQSTTRDKYNKCVECGIEIFSGNAKIVIEGMEFNKYVSGHVE